MADKITEIIGQEAFEQVATLKKDLSELVKLFETNAKVALLINSAMSNTKGIKEASDAIKEQQKSVSELDKLTAKLEKTQSELGRAEQELKLKIQEATQANKDYIKSEQAKEGSIEAMRLQLKAMQKEYDGLAKSEREAASGTQLLTKLGALDSELKKLEANTGRFQRNVGNYQSATFQLTQVLREIPAFTYSAQTGIMGISNNLPLLGDAFRKVKEETGSTVGALKVFGKSLLSFPNIAAVAIGLFTIFSDKIFEFFSNTKKANEELKKLGDEVGRETAKFELVNRQLNNYNLSYEERIKYASELKNMYPEILKNYSDEEIAAGKAAGAIMQIKNALISLAMARAGEQKLQDLASQKWQNEKMIYKKRAELLRAEQRFELAFNATKGSASEAAAIRSATEANNVNKLRNEIEKLGIESGKLSDEMNKVAEETGKYSSQSSILAKTKNDVTEATKKQTKAEKDLSAANKKQTKAEKDLSAANEKNIKRLNTIIQKLGDTTIRTDFESIDVFKEQLNKLTNETVSENEAALKEINEIRQKYHYEQMQMLQEEKQANDELRDTIISSNNEIGSTILDRLAWNINQRAEKETKYIDEREKAELESLERMTLSDKERAEKKKKIEIDAEQRRKQIEREKVRDLRRMAILQKNLDIGTIIANTAVAVTQALLDKTVLSPYARIANAVVIGLQGAAQLTKVIATPLPQYAEGTEGTPSDSFAIVGERGTELAENPDGSKWLTPNKATMVYLKKGTKITPHEKLMDSVYKGAYLKLGSSKLSDNGSVQGALIEQFAMLYGKFDSMEKTIKESAPIINMNGNFDHYMRIQKAKRIA